MVKFENFAIYKPDFKSTEGNEPAYRPDILYAKDKNGRDWYACQADFSPDTLKVMYDENGIIVCISKDVTAIFPPGFSVAEVAICEMPDDACNDTNWVYSDGKVVKRVYTAEEKRQKIEDEKSLRIDRVNQVTQSLHTKLMLGMCTIEEKDSLKKWMHYVNQINGIDSNMEPREIRWPESPEKITR